MCRVSSGRGWKHYGAARMARGGPASGLRTGGAFTLIELLVVVSIIALLISILLPSLKRAREQTKSTLCLSNMRQIGLALQTYAMENREYIPASSCPAAESPEEDYWLNVLQRCAHQPLIARCPKDKTTKPFLDWSRPPADPVTWQNYRWSSFAINSCLVPTAANPHEYNRLNRIPRPAYVIYLAGIRSGQGYDSGDHIHADLWEGLDDPTKEVAWDRHYNRSNYLFADGHVETLHWKKTWDYPTKNYWWPSHAPGWPPIEEPPP